MASAWIHFDFFTVVSGVAIMLMAVAFWKVFEYRSAMVYESAKRAWRTLVVFVILFCIGYLTLPFLILVPADWKDAIISLLFLFGAVFVLAVINLLYRIIISPKDE